MTKALDAAISAGINAHHNQVRWLNRGEVYKVDPIVKAALRAAFPAEPEPEDIEAMARAISPQKWANLNAGEEEREKSYACAAYRALRAQILGEEP